MNPQETGGESALLHVLAIDDLDEMAWMLKSTIDDTGAHTCICSSLQEAIDLLKYGEQFDLIVSDIELGLASGYELCAFICQEDIQIPVILTSSSEPIMIPIVKDRPVPFVSKADMGLLRLYIVSMIQYKRN